MNHNGVDMLGRHLERPRNSKETILKWWKSKFPYLDPEFNHMTGRPHGEIERRKNWENITWYYRQSHHGDFVGENRRNKHDFTMGYIEKFHVKIKK